MQDQNYVDYLSRYSINIVLPSRENPPCPVRTLKDMSTEEITGLEEQYGAKLHPLALEDLPVMNEPGPEGRGDSLLNNFVL